MQCFSFSPLFNWNGDQKRHRNQLVSDSKSLHWRRHFWSVCLSDHSQFLRDSSRLRKPPSMDSL
jgi:hypothetical protein